MFVGRKGGRARLTSSMSAVEDPFIFTFDELPQPLNGASPSRWHCGHH